MLALCYALWGDSPQNGDDDEAWHSELIQDLPAAKREAQREAVVALCDGVTASPPGSSSQVHPEECAADLPGEADTQPSWW